MTKKKLFYIIILFITVVCLLSGIFIPETGQLVLLKEFFTILLMIILAVAIGKPLPSIFKSKKIFKIHTGYIGIHYIMFCKRL